MKKFLALALSLVLVLALAACGNSGTGSKEPAGGDNSSSSDTSSSGSSEPQGSELAYPEKDITLIVPFDAGGGNDIYGRIIAKIAMENGYFNGRNIIVENQPGGGGAIGQAYVANTAEPDGYTLLTFTASGIRNPILKDVPFTVDDFKTIICANADPAVLVARADAPFDDLEGLLEYAKSNTLIANDSGFGTSSHVRTLDWTSKLEEATGTKINYDCIHVDSGSVQISELMGGHADLTCLTAGECADAILEGNIKGIAIMANERFEGLPGPRDLLLFQGARRRVQLSGGGVHQALQQRRVHQRHEGSQPDARLPFRRRVSGLHRHEDRPLHESEGLSPGRRIIPYSHGFLIRSEGLGRAEPPALVLPIYTEVRK